MVDDTGALLENFGSHFRNFAFDKAKETAEEFRTAKFPPSPTPGGNGHRSSVSNSGQEQFAWQSLIQCLPQLAVAEKGYMVLSFLLPKGFLRKENALRASYSTIRSDLVKISESLSCDVTEISGARQTVVEHLSSQLKRFMEARLDLISLYEKLSVLATSTGVKGPIFDDSFVSYMDEITQKYNGAFSHPLITGIVANLLSECEILSNLLKCHSKLTQLMFLDPLIHLKNAQAVLKQLSRTSPSETEPAQSQNWFGFGTSTKTPVLPPLFAWLRRYYDSLLSKFSLYFHDSLLKQTTPQEMRSQLSKTPENYLHRISGFHRKQDAAYICFILNSDGLTHTQWQGYRHPDHKTEPLKGLESYPVILSFPTGQERPANLLPSAIMIINEQSAKLASFDGVAAVFDDTKDVTYFVCRVEGQLYLLIMFKGRKNERDSYVIAFMHDMCADLRCVKVFAMERVARQLK